jgi:4-amino-4-deoxy-L-arabinose transferase-like glycosyltransferase
MKEEKKTKGRTTSHSPLWVGALVVAILTFWFFSLFFNRFAGVRAINGSVVVGQGLLSGKMPYRDWFAPVPPLNMLKNALVVRMFGSTVIASRVSALFERTLLALILYFWLARLFRSSHAAVGAVLAIVVSAGDVTDPISSYNHDTILLAVTCGFFASICLDRDSNGTAWLFALLTGISAGLCFATKQTIGLGVTVCVPILVAAALAQSARSVAAWRFLGWFILGWVMVAGAVLIFLARQDLAGAFLRQAFLRGPSAKAGSLSDFVIRWSVVTVTFQPLRTGCLIASIALVPTLISVSRAGLARANSRERWTDHLPVFLLGAVSIGGGIVAARAGMNAIVPLIKSSIYLVLIGTGVLATYYSALFVARRLSRRQAHFWLLATISFVCAFMLSLSWPAFEAMVIPGLGFFVAAALDAGSIWKRTAWYAVCGALLFSLTLAKLNAPFGFADWIEPSVATATFHSSLPEMRGFLLPEAYVRMIDGTTRIIRQHARPGDTIFTYPTMPIFHAITGLWFPTYAGDHNMDACPDDLASKDAETLLRKRPVVIIHYTQDPGFQAFEEYLWRHGKRSGQRDLTAAVETLAAEYQLAATFDAPPTKLKLKVYVRP